jgi:hypothetical protein
MTKTLQVVLQKNWAAGKKSVFNLWLPHQRLNISDQFFCSLPKNPSRDQNVLGSNFKKTLDQWPLLIETTNFFGELTKCLFAH